MNAVRKNLTESPLQAEYRETLTNQASNLGNRLAHKGLTGAAAWRKGIAGPNGIR
jgi:hypothetical protein